MTVRLPHVSRASGNPGKERDQASGGPDQIAFGLTRPIVAALHSPSTHAGSSERPLERGDAVRDRVYKGGAVSDRVYKVRFERIAISGRPSAVVPALKAAGAP